jgi:WD40 repeat protein
VAVLEGHTRTPWTLCFHNKLAHLLVSGCLNGELRVWDVRNRTCLRHAILGPDRVTSVAFRPHDSLVAAACGRDLYFWDVGTEERDGKAPQKGGGVRERWE